MRILGVAGGGRGNMPILVICKREPTNGLCWNHVGCLRKTTVQGRTTDTPNSVFLASSPDAFDDNQVWKPLTQSTTPATFL